MTTFKSKREALLAFLEKGMTMLHLDARQGGVLVPNQFSEQRDLRLNLSYRFGGTQLEIDEEKVEATLTFGGVPFRCSIPFAAIYALTSHVTGAGLVFPESLPDEILVALRQEIDTDSAVHRELAALGDGTAAKDPEMGAARGKARLTSRRGAKSVGRPTKVPHLRVIEGDKK